MPTSLTRRGPLLPTLLVAGVLIVAFMLFTEIWTQKLWFDSVGFASVFTTEWLVRIALFAGAFVAMAGLVGLNMWLAFRLRPVRPARGQSDVLDRYSSLLGDRMLLAIALPAGFFGLVAGMTAASQVMPVLAWLNRVPFGQADAYFGLDAGFYVFELPIWRDLLGFVMSALFFSLLAASVVHFATGGIALGRPGRRGGASAATRAHLSVLAGLVLVCYGLQTLLDRYGYLVENGTLFTGMHYTDATARLGAKLVMAIIAFICAALFFLNVFVARWVLPVTGLVLMLVSGLVLQVVYPQVVQSFQVRPNEPDKEGPYIQANINATRAAFGVDDVETEPYDAVSQVRPGQLRQDAEVLPGIRLIDPAVVSPTFEQSQQLRGYYSFPEILDVDRYIVDGAETDAVVAVRELDYAGIPDQNWNNLHTVYTHGYGLVAAYGNRRQTSGEPQWIESDLPPQGELGDFESRVYFGERTTEFAIVGREEGQQPLELDIPAGSGGDVHNTYSGPGGVPIGDAFTRLVYAAHFMDLNIVLSDRVNSASRILYDRTPEERVQQAAPWLTVDEDAYPAVVDGRTVWILDGYTVSASYPNSQLVSLRSSTADAQERLQADEQVNYIRNSVKAVVDATDGTVRLYAWDEADPILRAYQAAFPGTVLPRSEITPDLLAHLRYPQDLFKVQRDVLTRYHMTKPADWYQRSDLWQVPDDPTKGTTKVKEPPYYLSIKWPGEDEPVFNLTSVFVPNGRSNLTAYLAVVAEATSPDYGKLRVLRMADNNPVDGPGQTFNAMTTAPGVADVLRNYLNQGSAAAIYGNLLTLPMGSGLLYVLPVYAERSGSAGSYPVLSYVVVRFGQSVGIGKTLQEALDQTFAGDAGAETGEEPVDPTTPTTPTTPPTTPPTTEPTTSPTTTPSTAPTGTPDPEAAAALLKTAQDAFTAADAALRAGNLSEYQKQVDIARQALNEAMTKLNR